MIRRGFTLIELLIAMVITVVVSAAAVAGWQSVTDVERRLDGIQRELAALERAFLMLGRDLNQITARPITDELGGERRAIEYSDFDGTALEFTRAGWFNPAPELTPPRSDLQRVAYRVEDETLLRRTWFHLDRMVEGGQVDRLLLANIDRVGWRFLDLSGDWHTTWPPSNADSSAPFPIPRAIEAEIEHKTLGAITRLFAVP